VVWTESLSVMQVNFRHKG